MSNHIEKKITFFLRFTKLDNEYLKQNTIKLYLISRHKLHIALNYNFICLQHISLQTRIIHFFFYHNFNIILAPKTIWYIINFIKNTPLKNKTIKYNQMIININQSWIYVT